MSLSETQLQTWSNLGATTTAEQTYTSVKAALNSSNSRIRDKSYDVYLQGSYRNKTNIRGDSDVDVVVELQSVFLNDLSNLDQEAVSRFNASFSNADYSWHDFHADVLATLTEYYGGGRVEAGNKSIKVQTSGGLYADVVPALEYRKYLSFNSASDPNYIEGIKFYSRNTYEEIVNFPKQHYDNGVSKNGYSRTRENYKPITRMFKNARNSMVDRGIIQDGIAPSYFVQGLLYNVPDSQYLGSYTEIYCKVVNWLNSSGFEDFVCQNDLHYLFGSASVQWSKSHAKTFVNGLTDLWNNG